MANEPNPFHGCAVRNFWDGLPIVTTGLSPEREYIREYFDRNGLFVQSTENAGGSHALWFYPDVTWEHIQKFLTAHPWNGLGSFANVGQNAMIL